MKRENCGLLVTYIYIHTYIYGRIWVDRFSLSSLLSLCLLVIRRATIDDCAVRFFFVERYFFLVLFSARYCTNVRWNRGGENLKIFTPQYNDASADNVFSNEANIFPSYTLHLLDEIEKAHRY